MSDYAALIDPQTCKPRVLSVRCATCIFRPGNLMHLRQGRLADMVKGAFIPCHDTLPYLGRPRNTEALCRGWWDGYAATSDWWQAMMFIFGGYTEIPPPDEES